MKMVDFYSSSLHEEARQEIIDLWGEVLPMPYIGAGLLFGEVGRKIQEMDVHVDFASSELDPKAALEVVQTYLL